MHDLTVKQVNFLTSEVYELRLQRDQNLEFEPGDCVALFNDKSVSRPYSIASGINEDELAFLIRRMPNGAVSSWLANRVPGDIVRVSPPFGWFRPGQSGGDRSVFVATGTGIAPFLCYFRSFEITSNVKCYYGARRFEEVIDHTYLSRYCELHLAISRESVNGHHHGRVTDLLIKQPVDRQANYYLCGLDAMINQVSDWLEENGIDFTQIHREVFFHAAETQ